VLYQSEPDAGDMFGKPKDAHTGARERIRAARPRPAKVFCVIRFLRTDRADRTDRTVPDKKFSVESSGIRRMLLAPLGLPLVVAAFAQRPEH
jgi:hypothetical protein